MKRNSRQIVVTFPVVIKDIKEGLREIREEFRDLLYVHINDRDAEHLQRNLKRLLKRFYDDLDVVSQNSWEQDLKKLRRENTAILKKSDKLKGKTVKKPRKREK